MDWTNEVVLKFLELYEMNPCIWDPKHTSHKNKNRVHDAWVDIQNNMGVPCTVKELKKKRECLMSAYRGYRTKIKKSETSGAGTGDLYRPTWFAFQSMDSFLGPIYKCNLSMNTEVSEGEHNKQDAEVINTTSYDQNNTSDITNASNFEQETSPASTQRDAAFQQTFKRRMRNPPELQQAKKQMDQAFDILKTVSQQQHNNNDEDECQIFGKLIAKKLSKLPESRRDLLMIKINQLLYTENQEYYGQIDSLSMMSNDRENYYQHTPSPRSSTQHQDDNFPEVMIDTAIAANYIIS